MIYLLSISGFSHVTNYSTAFSSLGLDTVYLVIRVLHGIEHPCRRSGQPDWRYPVPVGLFRVSGAVAGGACGVV
jgi:hypothetical protein